MLRLAMAMVCLEAVLIMLRWVCQISSYFLLPVLSIRILLIFFPSDKPTDETDKAKGANDLPEFLKKRLKARGILKDKTENKNSVSTQNVSY
jgi:hypothetical protein